jgi:tetratricopeptide (TPR) repeat protein
MTYALDAYGQKVTGASAASVAALDRFGSEWISYGPDLAGAITAAEVQPDCALANAYAGLLHMSLEAASGYAAAAPFLKRLQDGASRVTAREQAIIDAALHWGAQDYPASLKAFEAAVGLSPADIVAAKWGQYLAFNLGDAAAMLRLGRQIMTAHRRTAEAWGMLAFAQEQSHQLHLAEDSAAQSLALNPRDAWAQHAMAHVYETHGRLDDGIRFLEQAAAGWSDRSIFMREHNYWHLALFHLDRDEPATAIDIYDRKLWGAWPEFAQEHIGAISMLWRLELRGVDVGNRWAPVAAAVMKRGAEHLWPFHDLHYIHAISRNGSAAATAGFMTTMMQKAERAGGVWKEVAVPAARAIVACNQGRHDDACDLLTPLLPQLVRIGGSHAQRDIFVQAWIDAAFTARRLSALEHVLNERQHARPTVNAHQRDLDRLQSTR